MKEGSLEKRRTGGDSSPFSSAQPYDMTPFEKFRRQQGAFFENPASCGLERERISEITSAPSVVYCESFVWTDCLFLAYNMICNWLRLCVVIMLPETQRLYPCV